MADRIDRHDRALADRLRAYEDAMPAGQAPDPTAARDRRRGWAVLLAGGTGAVAAGTLVALAIGSVPDPVTGQASPSAAPVVTASPSASSAVATNSPSPSPSTDPEPSSSAAPSATPAPTPSPVQPTKLEEVLRVDAGSRTALVNAMQPLGDGRFVAALNTSDWDNIPATGPHGMDGSIYLGSREGEWERADTGDTFGGVEITNLFVTAGGVLLAYGELDSYEGDTVSVGFTSTDAREWTRMADLPWRTSGWVQMAAGASGYVAVATHHDPAGQGRLVAYRSSDGLAWSVIYESPGDASYSHHDIGAGPEGIVITGYRFDESSGEGRAISVASADGVEWFMSPEDGSLAPEHNLNAVAPFGPDWIAGAFAGEDGGIPVYWSANGLDWIQVATIRDPEGREHFGYAAHVVASGDRVFLSAGFMAEGTESRPAGVWTSTDGHSWSIFPTGGLSEVRTLVGLESGAIVAGRVNQPGADETHWSSNGDAVIWRSPD